MEDVFKFKNLTYNFRNVETLNISNVNSVKYGTATITSLGAKIWKILPNDYKELTFLSTFKSKIKNWEPLQLVQNKRNQGLGFLSNFPNFGNSVAGSASLASIALPLYFFLKQATQDTANTDLNVTPGRSPDL